MRKNYQDKIDETLFGVNNQYEYSYYEQFVCDFEKKNKLNINMWNLSNMFLVTSKLADYIYDFDQIGKRNIIVVKYLLIYYFLHKNNKCSGVKDKFTFVKKLVLYFQNKKSNLDEISIYELETFFEIELNDKLSKKFNFDKLSWTKDIFNILKLLGLINEEYYSEIKEIIANIRTRIRNGNSIKKGIGHKIIPRALYNKIIILSREIIYNYNFSNSDKMTAAMIIILADTGMRIDDFRKLKINAIEKIKVKDKEYKYLKFESSKSADLYMGYEIVKCIITNHTEHAYNTILEITQKSREINNSEFLILNRENKPFYDSSAFGSQIIRFMIKYNDRLDCIDTTNMEIINYLNKKSIEEIKKSRIKSKSLLKFLSDKSYQNIYYITPHQFRVTICNRLYKKGVHLHWIKVHMNHLYDEITNSYLRSEIVKDKEKTTLVVLEKVNRYTKNIEKNDDINNSLKEDLRNSKIKDRYERIKKFIEFGEINVEGSLKEIIEKAKEYSNSIVEVELGYCIKNEFSKICIYEESKYKSRETIENLSVPDVMTMYKTIDRFKDLFNVFEHNRQMVAQDLPYDFELSRSIEKLRRFIEGSFMPEYELFTEIVRENRKDILNQITLKIENGVGGIEECLKKAQMILAI